MSGKTAVKTLSVFLFCLLLGGAIALVGVRELNLDKRIQLKKTLATTTDASGPKLLEVLHGDTHIEKAGISPEAIENYKKNRDKLSADDKSAMKRLIEKVTQ